VQILKRKKEKKRKMIKTGNYNLKLNLSFFLFIFFMGASYAMAANQSTVRASVDRDQMGIGDSFTLSVEVVSNEDFESEPKLPTLNGIEVLNSWADGKSSSTRMTFINGKSEYSKTVSQQFHFMLSPQKEGRLVIPVIDVEINGQTYKTQPLTISVAEEYRGARPKPQSQRGVRPQLVPGFDEEDPFAEDDIFNQLMKQREKIFDQLRRGGGANPLGGGGSGAPIPERKLNINTNEAFFIHLDVDRTEAYEGQQITANWYIYVRGQIESLDRTKFPDLKGFWKEIVEEVPSLQFFPEIVNGVTYQKALLASHALFPIKPGVAVIDEFKIKARTRTPTQFGLGKPHDFTKVSKRQPIQVLALPTEGKPLNFSGAVGSFQVNLKTEGLQFPAHQPFLLKVRFEGSGNAKLIDLPVINWPASLEVFDTKSESRFFKNGQSYKEFEILLVPRQEGTVTIPAIEFSHFDPEQKKYISSSTEPLVLTITPGTPGATNLKPGGPSGATTDSRTLSAARPILEMPEASMITLPMRWGIYLGLFVLSLFGIAGSFFRQFQALKQDPILDLIVQRKLQLIQQNLNTNNFRQVGAEGVNLVYALAAYLSGEKTANQEWLQLTENIPIKLKEKFLPSLASSFDFFQLLGFAPDAVHAQIVSANKTENEIEKLKKVAIQISDELKKNETES